MLMFNIENLTKSKAEQKFVEIPIKQIKPNHAQPRLYFDDAELISLSKSIQKNGILQPLSVRKINNCGYELIAGERRLRAAMTAGLKKVPCILNECTEEESALFALIENLQRVDLTMFEEARGIAKLMRKYKLTQEQVATQMGKKQCTIANKLKLLKLTLEEQEWIINAKLSERHARCLVRIPDFGLRKQALSKVITEEMSIKDTEKYVDSLISQEKEQNKRQVHKILVKDLKIFVNSIERAISTMRIAGIEALSEKSESDNYIEYRVKIPKI